MTALFRGKQIIESIWLTEAGPPMQVPAFHERTGAQRRRQTARLVREAIRHRRQGMVRPFVPMRLHVPQVPSRNIYETPTMLIMHPQMATEMRRLFARPEYPR